MTNPYGPWATAIDAGRNPQLSAFWQQRLGMLVPASQTSPVLSRRNLLWLGLVGAMICILPTFRAASAGAEEKKPPISTVHVVTEVRTLPRDNFVMIGPDCDFVTVEIWKDFGEPQKWRVEKPGRVIVMDGASTLNFIRPNEAYKLPYATKAAFDTGPLLRLAQDQDALAEITQLAKVKGWDCKLAHEMTAAGEKTLVLTVEVKATLPDGDYCKNNSLDDADSDMRRVYRFDAQTQRLEHVDFYLHQPSGDTLILKTNRIEYNEPPDPQTFSLKLPEDVVWIKDVEKLPDNEKYERMTPKEMARAFFDACAKRDWAEAEKFWGGSPMSERVKVHLGGLKVIHLGEPFESKGYASPGKGWFVPYEIKYKDGTVIKHNLAVRKDNPANRYVVDGGI